MSDFKLRILAFIDYIGVGQSTFEKSAGLSNGAVNNIRRGLRSESVDKIISAYPHLNKVWLLTGSGEMLNNTESTYLEKRRGIKKPP